ncbi:MAG: hypothetical protein JF609_09485 [Verrucomicrobia bacterium]|nr:hypothetical protein [Verrucomicrobiota bacterium]
MNKKILAQITANAVVTNQYKKQLARVKQGGAQTEMIAEAVDEVIGKLPKASTASLVIYGDPQSGKTEMMICLTAALLDT